MKEEKNIRKTTLKTGRDLERREIIGGFRLIGEGFF